MSDPFAPSESPTTPTSPTSPTSEEQVADEQEPVLSEEDKQTAEEQDKTPQMEGKVSETEPKPVDTSTVEDDPRFSFGPPKIQTAQDAVEAFLRKEIDEDQLRAAVAKFGVLPDQLFPGKTKAQERLDVAFEQKIPDDLYYPSPVIKDDVETRIEAAEEKERAREEATEKTPETLLVSQVPAPASATSPDVEEPLEALAKRNEDNTSNASTETGEPVKV